MAIDLEALLAPISEEQPTGEDLEYDPQRQEVALAFESSVSMDTSGEMSEAADVDWKVIVASIVDLSARTQDLTLPVYLCRAGARTGLLETVETGALYLAGMLEAYWPKLHPELDYGFQARKNPVESLANPGQFLTPLRNIVLLEDPRLGRFTGADFDRFRQNAEAEDGYGMFRAALQNVPEESLLETVARLDRMNEGFRRADRVLVERGRETGDTGANLQPLYDTLALLKRGVLAFTTQPEPEPEVAPGPDGPTPTGGGPRLGGRVDSREDVITALEAVADYYRRSEPSSPVPAVLQRARAWVTMDFLSLLQDIAPGSLDEARTVLVQREKDGSGSE